MNDRAGPRGAQVQVGDAALREALGAALAGGGFALVETGGDLLVHQTCGAGLAGAAGLGPEALGAVEAFASVAPEGRDRSVVLVAGAQGPHGEALAGAVRALAAALAPGVRVNAVAPEREGAPMAADQVCAATLYLANAAVVTGQALRAGA